MSQALQTPENKLAFRNWMLQIGVDEYFLPEGSDYDRFRSILIEFVQELMDKDFERLMHILYRIDVNEQALKKALHEGPIDEGSSIIADMMITRQLQKIETRRRYS